MANQPLVSRLPVIAMGNPTIEPMLIMYVFLGRLRTGFELALPGVFLGPVWHLSSAIHRVSYQSINAKSYDH
jgi:hypothetical protein